MTPRDLNKVVFVEFFFFLRVVSLVFTDTNPAATHPRTKKFLGTYAAVNVTRCF